ncbi:MAG: hypothetical protein ACXADO_05570 [Candidatus Thorarchaeota archaeon]
MPWKVLRKISLSLEVMRQYLDRRKKPGLWEGHNPNDGRQSLDQTLGGARVRW